MNECEHTATITTYDHRQRAEVTICEECGIIVKEEKRCDGCGKLFDGPDTAVIPEKVYCSEDCYKKDQVGKAYHPSSLEEMDTDIGNGLYEDYT